MKDLIRCTVSRDDFQRWLDLGTAPLTLWQGEKVITTLLKLEKNPSADYLYRTAAAQDNSISWNNLVQFCGVWDNKNRMLYLTEDTLGQLTAGKYQFISAGPSMTEEIRNLVNSRVESIIADDRNNLAVREVTGWRALKDLDYYRNYGAKEEAIRRLFSGEEPDGHFHSRYRLDSLPETDFLACLEDLDGFIEKTAEQHIEDHQESFLMEFLEKDALLREYQLLMQDTENPLHRMKAITEAVKSSGAKTVSVTVQKSGEELTFRTAAGSLTGHRNYYNTNQIAASDRREFERLFGRNADYTAEEITRITYGRNTIYEAPPVQSEAMAEEESEPTLTMGGMS